MEINITSYKKQYIQVDSPDYLFLRDLKEYFTDYAEAFRFNPKYLSGQWNGKICLVRANNILPYGLLLDVIGFKKKEYPNFTLKVDKEVSVLFKGDDIDFEPTLNLYPRDYQLDCIVTALKYKRGVIRSSTASGKSLVIAYIINALRENDKGKHFLIIVPRIALCEQFKNDLIDYGLNDSDIGIVHAKSKVFNKMITISTWQSLSRNNSYLGLYDSVMCDEVHEARSHEIRKILELCTNADYRIGFTGTLPVSKLDMWNIKSFLGPVLREYGAGELAEKGYISKCKVKVITVSYNKEYEGEYNDIKDEVFNNPFRMNLLKNIVREVDGNILVLVGKVEKEGKILRDYFNKCKDLQDKEIVFMWGDTKVEEREYWRKECEVRKNIILIATYGILSVGTNIPSLKYILLASPFKSKIRVLQSIGRSLRKHEDKEDGAVIYDIADECKFLSEHAIMRQRYYDSEKFMVEESTMNETQSMLLI